MKLVRYIGTISVLVFLTGCGAGLKNLGKSSAHMQEAKQASTKQEYQKLFQEYKEQNKTKDLLWDYEAGTVGNYVAAYKESVFYFDRAEDLIKKYDEEVLASKALANIGAVLTNDTFMAYRPRIYEKIMVNTYKAIDFIELGDWRNARIEFNRALVRQKRAAKFFEKEIALEKKKIKHQNEEKLKKSKKSFSLNKVLKNKKTLSPIEKKYKNLFTFKPYRDFVNPFSTYLAGLYFLNRKDYRKAEQLLKETYGMIKGRDNGASYVLKDWKLANNMKRSIRSRKQHFTWVIFFNGKAPKKEELRIDIPLFLFSNDVYYTGIALPTLKTQKAPYPYLLVNKKKTKRVASMDRIIKQEFKKRFPTIMTRALARTIVQTVIQKRVNDKLQGVAAVTPMGFLLTKGLSAAAQAVLNRADTRMWERLPKEFQVARVKSGTKLVIQTPNKKKITTLRTKPNKSYIVFITIPTKNNEAIINYKEL